MRVCVGRHADIVSGVQPNPQAAELIWARASVAPALGHFDDDPEVDVWAMDASVEFVHVSQVADAPGTSLRSIF